MHYPYYPFCTVLKRKRNRIIYLFAINIIIIYLGNIITKVCRSSGIGFTTCLLFDFGWTLYILILYGDGANGESCILWWVLHYVIKINYTGWGSPPHHPSLMTLNVEWLLRSLIEVRSRRKPLHFVHSKFPWTSPKTIKIYLGAHNYTFEWLGWVFAVILIFIKRYFVVEVVYIRLVLFSST